MGHITERSIGSSDAIEVELQASIELAKSDVLLLCSDGLWGLIEDEELAELFQESDLKTAAERAIGMAMQRGADDNTTLGVLRMELGPVEVEEVVDVREALYAKGAQQIAQREEAAAERAHARQAMVSQIPAISHTPPVDDSPLMVANKAVDTGGRSWMVIAAFAILSILIGFWWIQGDEPSKSSSSVPAANESGAEGRDGSDGREDGADDREDKSTADMDVGPVDESGSEKAIEEPAMDAPQDVVANSPDAETQDVDASGTEMIESSPVSEDAANDRLLGFDDAQEEMGMGGGGMGESSSGGNDVDGDPGAELGLVAEISSDPRLLEGDRNPRNQ